MSRASRAPSDCKMYRTRVVASRTQAPQAARPTNVVWYLTVNDAIRLVSTWTVSFRVRRSTSHSAGARSKSSYFSTVAHHVMRSSRSLSSCSSTCKTHRTVSTATWSPATWTPVCTRSGRERALRPFPVGRPRLQPSVWSDAMRKRTTTMTTTLGVAHHDVYIIAKSVHSISKSHTISCLDPQLRRLVSRLSPNRSDVCQRRRGRHDPRAADWLRPRASGVVGPVIRCVPHAAPTKETCRRRPRLRALQCVQAEGSGRAADTLATSRADYRACRTLVRR
jgi:hypothetical protein